MTETISTKAWEVTLTVWDWRSRWRYVYAGRHMCLTRRTDGLTRFYWLALSIFDVKVYTR